VKIFKRVLLGLGIVVVLLICIGVYVAMTFDANAYKPDLIKAVKERTGRTLVIQGPIALKFFPKIGAHVEGVSLSEPNSQKIFAKIDEAAAALALLPLLKKEVIVDQLTLVGLQADLHRRKDGSLNIDDLIESQDDEAKAQKKEPGEKKEPVSLDIGGISLKNANLGWRDDTKNTQLRLSDLNLSTGRIASDVPGDVEFNTRIERAQPRLALKVEMKAGYRVNFDTHAAELSDLDLKLTGDAGAYRGLDLSLKGGLRGNWAAEHFDADLRAKLGDSNVHLKAGVKGFDHPAIELDLEADRLDIDRYRGEPAPGNESRSGVTAPASDTPKNKEAPIDLSALESVDARGGARVGDLKVADLEAKDFSLRFDLRNGHLKVDPLKAKFYGGELAGNFAIDARRHEFIVKQNAAGVDVGPLLRALADKDLLEGRGTVDLDVRTVGKTVSALKRGLDGKAALSLKDGMLKGVNLAQMLRKAKAVLGSKSAAEELAQGGEKTDFSDMSASFDIKNGVAHNEDLLMRSPFLRVTGAGDIDIGQGRMEYIAKVAVVGTSTGQEGKELDSLKGITVPVGVSGPLAQLKYRLEVKEMAKDAAKKEIEKQLEKHLGGGKSGKEGGGSLRDLFKKK
jgi:AsmA protein